MSNRKCARCGQIKLEIEFTKDKDGYFSSYCHPCLKEYRQEYYNKNRQKHITAAVESRRRLGTFIDDLKDRPCTDCGVKYPLGDKIECLSKMRQRGAAREDIVKEVSKCEVVCANCHRQRTHDRVMQDEVAGDTPSITN